MKLTRQNGPFRSISGGAFWTVFTVLVTAVVASAVGLGLGYVEFAAKALSIVIMGFWALLAVVIWVEY